MVHCGIRNWCVMGSGVWVHWNQITSTITSFLTHTHRSFITNFHIPDFVITVPSTKDVVSSTARLSTPKLYIICGGFYRLFTQCGMATIYDDILLCQAIIWRDVDYSVVRFCCIHLSNFAASARAIIIYNEVHKYTVIWDEICHHSLYELVKQQGTLSATGRVYILLKNEDIF